MKSVYTLLIAFIPLASSAQSGVLALSVVTNNADTIPLSTFAGKKIWVVVLPSSQGANDSIFLQQVNSISRIHESELQTIAVPSYEDGFMDDSAPGWYQNILDSPIIIGQPLYTHKTSGSEQNRLFGGLSRVDQNMHFDDDISGTGCMFFINAAGALYSSTAAQATISQKYVSMVLP